jgi:hypothetical protein
MANPNAPHGARPLSHLDGSSWNGKTRKYYIPSGDSTAVYVYDFVKLVADTHTDGTPICAQAGVGDTLLGVVTSIVPQATRPNDTYRPASTGYYVNVCDAPDVVYEMQEDSAGNNIGDSGNLCGGNADLVVGTGSSVTGLSGMLIDSSGLDADTAQLRVLRLHQKPGNDIGQYAVWEVVINEHIFKTTTGVE